MAKAKGVHYVNNKEFLEAMIEWKNLCIVEEKKG